MQKHEQWTRMVTFDTKYPLRNVGILGGSFDVAESLPKWICPSAQMAYK